jgi:hypothetical protein
MKVLIGQRRQPRSDPTIFAANAATVQRTGSFR